MGATENNWATPMQKENPFWRDDMTPDEYMEENEYLGRNFEKLRKGTYIPLWKQRQNSKKE